MSKKAAAIALMLLLASFVLLRVVNFHFREPEKSGHELLVDESYINLGEILQNCSAKHEFQLTNGTSSKELVIVEMQKSCGCTEVNIEKYKIKPGESVKCTIGLNAQNRLGDFASGVKIKWRVGGEPMIKTSEIILSAKAVTTLNVEPKIIEFGEFDSRLGKVFRILTLERGGAHIPWDDLKFSILGSENLKLQTKRDNRDSYTVTVTVDSKKAPIGPLKSDLLITMWKSGSQIDRPFVIPITGKVKGDIQARPSSVFLGVIKKGEIKKGFFTVESTIGESIELVSIDPKDFPAFDIVCTKEENGKLRVSYTVEATKTESISGMLRLHIKSRSAQWINVPVIAAVQ